MIYFERAFQEFWPQTKKQILCRTYILQNSHFLTKLPLAACGTFHFSKFVYISLLILHVRIKFLKESQEVAMKSFSIELIEAIVHKCFKKRCFRNIGGAYRKTLTAKCNLRQQGVIWLTCPQTSKPKLYENCATWTFICMSFACPFHVCFPLG